MHENTRYLKGKEKKNLSAKTVLSPPPPKHTLNDRNRGKKAFTLLS
jgi:hypothetical protein